MSLFSQGINTPGLRVQGRFLYTPCGDKVILRGVNKMIIFTDDTALRRQTYGEIRKTGANSVRIVWLAEPTDQADAGPDGLDRNIQYCINNDMIPIVELHDATGDWSALPRVVNYWLRPDVVNVIKKHERYLIINIGNEVGDDQVTADMFRAGYENSIAQMRQAGIHVPLIIDASSWGKDLAMLRQAGQYLIDKDPDHNLMFSVHTYWAVSEGANDAFITNELQQSVNINLPLIIGEFTYKFTEGGPCDLITDYQSILQRSQEMQIGWLAWEWGPGNDFFEKTCDVMDMTKDSHYNTLKEGWATDVVKESPYGIANTSITTKYIENGGVCDTIQSAGSETEMTSFFTVTADPARGEAVINLSLAEPGNISLDIYNALGSLSANIFSGMEEAGLRTYRTGDYANLPSGVYFCVLREGGERKILKFIIDR